MKALIVSMLVAVAGFATAIPLALPEETNYQTGSVFDMVKAEALRVSGGDLSKIGGTMIQWGPGKTIVSETPVDGYQFLEFVSLATRHVDHGTEAATPDGGIGFGVNDRTVAGRLGWPFCDYASIFQFYFGAPGSGIAKADSLGAALPVSNGPICGGFYGPTQGWSDVTFDNSGLSVLISAGAAMVMVPTGGSSSNVGVTGGYVFSPSSAMSAHGNGALYSIGFFGLGFDYFLGGGNAISVGSAQA